MFGFITTNLLNNLVNFSLPIIGIGLIVFLVIMVPKVKNGASSMKDILVGALAFVLLGGIVVFAGSAFNSSDSGTNNAVKTAVDNGANQVAKDADSTLGGDSTTGK